MGAMGEDRREVAERASAPNPAPSLAAMATARRPAAGRRHHRAPGRAHRRPEPLGLGGRGQGGEPERRDHSDADPDEHRRAQQPGRPDSSAQAKPVAVTPQSDDQIGSRVEPLVVEGAPGSGLNDGRAQG